MRSAEELFAELLVKQNSKKLNIVIVGDAMLDVYYKVEVTRISPEAAIPIMLSGSEKPTHILPGGAANVAYQFSHFNTDAKLCSFIDHEAKHIFNVRKIDTACSVNISNKIPRKRRFYDSESRSVISRWDIEQRNYGFVVKKYIREQQQRLLQKLLDSDVKPDAIIFSDYNKGVFAGDIKQEWSKLSEKYPTIVDPKEGPVSLWKGCTIFKPNADEAFKLTGEKDWQDQCRTLRQSLQTPNNDMSKIVITQGGKGVVGLDRTFFEYYKEHSAAESVIGAGDAFIAFLTMAHCYGFTIQECVAIAYEAGTRYVLNRHNKPLSPSDFTTSKIVNPGLLTSRGYTLAFTNGIFDLGHVAHLESLKFAKSKADKLVVAVNSDSSTRRLKGTSRPIIPLGQRMEMLAALEIVDFVMFFNEDTPEALIERIKPDCIIKSGDYKKADVAGVETVGEENVHIAPYIEGISTSAIIEKIRTSPSDLS